MKYAFDANTRTHSWTTAAGRSVEFSTLTMAAALRELAEDHGVKQKIGDAAAIAKNTTTGKSASEDDKLDAMQKVIDVLSAGEWNGARESGPRIDPLLVSALVNVTGKELAKIRGYLAGKTPQQRAAIAADAKYAKEYRRLQIAAVADVPVDTSEIDAL